MDCLWTTYAVPFKLFYIFSGHEIVFMAFFPGLSLNIYNLVTVLDN